MSDISLHVRNEAGEWVDASQVKKVRWETSTLEEPKLKYPPRTSRWQGRISEGLARAARWRSRLWITFPHDPRVRLSCGRHWGHWGVTYTSRVTLERP